MKIDKLDMTNFKSFRKAALRFPQLTLMLGSNASGKSNVRDALRSRHCGQAAASACKTCGCALKMTRKWS